jgi:hypothetical protein
VNWKRIIELILVFIIGSLLGYWLRPTPDLKTPDIQILKTDSIIRDSIYIVNDCIRTKIIYLEQKYDKETSTIMSNSDSANIEFFTRYLEDYKRTTENN